MVERHARIEVCSADVPEKGRRGPISGREDDCERGAGAEAVVGRTATETVPRGTEEPELGRDIVREV